METETLFLNSKLELSRNGIGKFILVVSDRCLANRINAALGQYYSGSIKRGEEPIFKITVADGLLIANSCFKPSLASVLAKIFQKS